MVQNVTADDRQAMIRLGAGVASHYENLVTAYVCGSLVEGFGNGTSDLDCFVLTDGLSRRRADGGESARFDLADYRVDIDYADRYRTDTECWDISRVCEIADEINSCPVDEWTAPGRMNMSWFQLAHGIHIGWAVHDDAEFTKLRDRFDWPHLCHVIYCGNMLQYTGFAEDAVGAVQAGDPGTALLTSRLALGYAADALLAAHGSTNIKQKWRFAKMGRLGLDALAERYLEAELEPSHEPADIIKRSKRRLGLAADLTIEAAQAVGRLPAAGAAEPSPERRP
jgi:predicted nucleotidyltransferase